MAGTIMEEMGAELELESPSPYPSSGTPAFVTRRSACVTVSFLFFLILATWCFAVLLIAPITLNRMAIDDLQEENAGLRSDLDATTELAGQLEDYVIMLGEKVTELFRINHDRCIDDYMDLYVEEHPEILGDGSAANMTAVAVALLPAAEEACTEAHDLL